MNETHQARQDLKHLFVGNQLWLDFVNTEIVAHGQKVDLLDSFPSLIAWLKAATVFGGSEIEKIEEAWGRDPRTILALEQAQRFRGILRNLADLMTQGQPVPSNAIAAINETLRHRTGYPQVLARPLGFERRVYGEVSQPEHLLAPVAESVTDFLCQSDGTLLKRCENPACVLYFYDTTKNHARRWCSMSGCGNRMKAAAHYRRAKAAKDSKG